MSHRVEQHRSTPEPLPADFEAELQRIDDLLAAHARSQRPPRGMLGRIEAVTTPLLAGGSPGWRLVGAHSTGHVGRLALAASLALAFMAAAQFLTAPTAPPSDVEWLLTMGRSQDGYHTINALLDSSAAMEHEVGYLIDMRGMDAAHVTDELDNLEAALNERGS